MPTIDLTDLSDALDLPKLRIPLRGKVYIVLPCSGKAWLQLQDINNRASEALAESGDPKAEFKTGVTEDEMFKLALGDTYDELMAEVSVAEIRHAAMTAYYWQLGDEAVAVAVWESAGKAPEPVPAPRRRRTSNSTRSAPTRTASRTTTTSPRKSQPKRPAKQ